MKNLLSYFPFFFLIAIPLLQIHTTKETFYQNGEAIGCVKKNGEVIMNIGLTTKMIDANGDGIVDYKSFSICSKFGGVSGNLPITPEDQLIFKHFFKKISE